MESVFVVVANGNTNERKKKTDPEGQSMLSLGFIMKLTEEVLKIETFYSNYCS